MLSKKLNEPIIKCIYLLVLLFLAAIAVQPTYAASLTVDSTADTVAADGVCTLREAISNATGMLTVSNSTISNNDVSGGTGGGILHHSGTATVSNSTITNNSAGSGGGISSFATLDLNNTIIANSTNGGDCHGGSGNDWLFGGLGNDLLYGKHGLDVLYGGPDADEMHGGPGHDWLGGDGGDDILFGGLGDDVLEGHQGNDTLDGGPGNDDDCWGGDDTDTAVNCEAVYSVP
jgi:CSLREA domain-containing protein